ncbi:DUF4826 family protein [Brevifollis gellanilyticus]|uniref:DUF4826 domain-containing protein n=1 Tax=Brevifollis gellanilyticus TaxID=748831 RepID=A0A512MI07_9BACT|nr:DUF4826 family protein [Brevifollis gellanilyticus]GEP46375.1 hypothetical protein BGE01nite_56660 [Brevifollis gellanilyticus]
MPETPDSPETPESAWITAERGKVIAYLAQQGCQHGGVGQWPALHLDQCFAIWAVQSLKAEGRTGWWAISGDLPTDYMSASSTADHPRAAMRHFSTQWLEIAAAMAAGKPREGDGAYMMGTPDEWPRLEPMLRSRAELLHDLAEDPTLWAE